MRKHGPCHHCGVKETPLWRNGPPEKPVLCNACGSRWRIRGNLNNYLPNSRGQGSRRGRKRSRKDNDSVFGYNVKWMEDDEDEEDDNDDEDEEEDEDEDEEWNSGDRRSKRIHHGHSGSDSMMTTSDEPSNLYEVVVKSEIIISDDDDDDGSYKSSDAHQVPNHGDDEDDDDPLAHIKMLQRELYKIFKNQKLSSSSSSSCSSLAEPPPEDQVLIYNPSYNPHFSENEIGFGSFLLKPP